MATNCIPIIVLVTMLALDLRFAVDDMKLVSDKVDDFAASIRTYVRINGAARKSDLRIRSHKCIRSRHGSCIRAQTTLLSLEAGHLGCL